MPEQAGRATHAVVIRHELEQVVAQHACACEVDRIERAKFIWLERARGVQKSLTRIRSHLARISRPD